VLRTSRDQNRQARFARVPFGVKQMHRASAKLDEQRG